jgi:outer membrane protein assembly factor BamB
LHGRSIKQLVQLETSPKRRRRDFIINRTEKTGRLLWADVVDKGAGLDSAFSVALHDGRVFVVGSGGASCSFDPSSNCDWLIRTYDLETGALIWEKQVDRNHQDDQANVVLACGDRVVVAGLSGNNSAAQFYDWRVQVLAAKTGKLVWEDVLSTPDRYSNPVGLAVAGNRLFVTGPIYVSDGSQNGDFVVRAYQFGVEGDDCKMIANNATAR